MSVALAITSLLLPWFEFAVTLLPVYAETFDGVLVGVDGDVGLTYERQCDAFGNSTFTSGQRILSQHLCKVASDNSDAPACE